MRTVIGLFDDRIEAMNAYNALRADGFSDTDLDILTDDDRDDESKLERIREYVPEPDSSIYLDGVRRGGTLVTVRSQDGHDERATEIMSGYNTVDVQERYANWRTGDVSGTGTGMGAGAATGMGAGTAMGAGAMMAGTRRDYATYENDFRDYYTLNWAGSGKTYDQYSPGLRYGYDLANNNAYRDRRWSEIEADARRDWELRYPATAWDQIKDSVQYAWEKVTGQR